MLLFFIILYICLPSCLTMTIGKKAHTQKASDKVAHGDALAKDLMFFIGKHKMDFHNEKNTRKQECGIVSEYSVLDCDLCTLVISTLRMMVKQDTDHVQEDIMALITDVCVELKLYDDKICKAIPIEGRDEFFGVLTRLVLSPKEACSLILGSGCGDTYNPFHMWNVTLSNNPKSSVMPPIKPKDGAPRKRFLHLTDIHLDPRYTAGSNAECGEPLCCRSDNGKPAAGHTGAGLYGDLRQCDIPRITIDHLLKHLNETSDQFDYVIFTGDLPPHNVWNQSRDDQLLSLATITNLLRKYLPNKLIFNAVGNHESAPVNSFPPPFIKDSNKEDWLYTALADSWRLWLPNDTVHTIRRGAFYSTSPFPGLKIISLNMNYCLNTNFWLLINSTDPAGMLQWLVQELRSAENKGEKVHIIGHIMPGCQCCMKPFSWNYYKIVNRFESTISGQFFGHSHTNSYELFYDELTKRPSNMAYITGSITTYVEAEKGVFPGYRIFEVDGDYKGSSWGVIDYTNYYANLTEANRSGKLVWQTEYNAKTEYGLETLNASDWNDLIYRMKANDTLFETYCRHYYKLAPNNCKTCRGNCKIKMLCELKSGRSSDPSLCEDL